MPYLFVLQSLVVLLLALSCWRYARVAAEANAALWQALAVLRSQHNALESATAEAFGEVDVRFNGLDEFELTTVARPPSCNCKRCRTRRELETN